MRVVGRAVAALCVLGVAASVAAADRGLRGRLYVEDEVIVKFKTGVIAPSMHATTQAIVPGASIAKSMMVRSREGLGHLALLRAPRGRATVEELVRRFAALPEVEFAEPNYIASIPAEAPKAATATPWPSRTFGRSRGTASTRETSHRDREVARTSVPEGGAASAREVSGESLVAMGVYPSDSYSQWGWGYVSSDVIWRNANASPLVAVIDTGVDYTHPDLSGKIVKGRNFVADTLDPMDDHGHGTHVAGVIAARMNNKVGIPGVSNGRVLAIKALDFAGFGTYYEIAQAIHYAADYPGVKVINMSLGGYADATTLSDAVYNAVVTKGKLLVAAAGNDNISTRLYPAGYSDNPAFLNRVLAVAASGVYVTPSSGGEDVLVGYCKADYSNYGTWVNIMAPGTDIISTLPTKASWIGYYYGLYNYGVLSGTSMATPHVAGVAARVWSVNPLFTNVQIARRLTEGGSWPPDPTDVAPGPVYTVWTGPVDVDDDGTNEIDGVTSFCWDPEFATGRPLLPDMADADVAMGMQRGEISAWIYDATNGNALPPGTVVQAWQGAAMKGRTAMTSYPVDQMAVVVSNLPWYDDPSTTYQDPYTMKVYKSGYTASVQAFGFVWLPSWSWVRVSFGTDLALPKISSNRTFVTNWPTFWNDVDQHLLLPQTSPPPYGNTAFDVGTDLGWVNPLQGTYNKTTITSLPPAQFGTGTLGGGFPSCYPCARYMADSYFTGLQGVETTAAKSLYPTTMGPYRLFNRDYTSGLDLTEGYFYWYYYDHDPVGPTMRLWQGGVIKATVSADYATLQSSPACTFDGGAAVCDKWYVGNLSSTGVFTPVNEIGDGVFGAVVPYGGANLKAGIAATTP